MEHEAGKVGFFNAARERPAGGVGIRYQPPTLDVRFCWVTKTHLEATHAIKTHVIEFICNALYQMEQRK